jgi:hypothetical protein
MIYFSVEAIVALIFKDTQRGPHIYLSIKLMTNVSVYNKQHALCYVTGLIYGKYPNFIDCNTSLAQALNEYLYVLLLVHQ